MKITITQPEIHQAIEAFIRGQISINDGMKVEINLRATRGEDGATAEIDIVPDVPEPVVEEAPKATVTRKPRAPKLDIATKVEEAKAEPALQPEPEPEPEPEPGITEELPEDPEPNSEAALAAEAAATEPVIEPVEPEAPAEPAPVRQSLFGGLKKPVNE